METLMFCTVCQTDYDLNRLCLHLLKEKHEDEQRAKQLVADYEASLTDHDRDVSERLFAVTFGARRSDPETSHEAARDANSEGIQNAIRQAFLTHGPGTEEEVSEWTGIPRPSLSPQFAPLLRAGVVINLIDPATNKFMKRKNVSGKPALVRGLPSQQN